MEEGKNKDRDQKEAQLRHEHILLKCPTCKKKVGMLSLMASSGDIVEWKLSNVLCGPAPEDGTRFHSYNLYCVFVEKQESPIITPAPSKKEMA
jgi:hypothetical protein